MRDQWNDRALDQLEARVEGVERDVEALRTHDPGRGHGFDVKTLLIVLSTIVVPIVVAIILDPGSK